MNDLVIFFAVIFTMFLCYAFGYVMGFTKGHKVKKKDKKTNRFPKCDCADINQCTTWCHAKQSFAEDFENGIV